jgi:hypothetical protein
MLNFRAPFNLEIDTNGLPPSSALLCRSVRPMVIASGLLLSAAALAHRHEASGLATGLFVCSLPLLALLFVPGLIAFQQEYRLGRWR